MKPFEFKIDSLLQALQRHCVAEDIAEEMGCHSTTVRRHLLRAELAELVTLTKVCGSDGKIDVWELTAAGRERASKTDAVLTLRVAPIASTP